MSRKDKETIVFVVNVGSSSDSETDKKTINDAKRVMKNVIEKKIFLQPKDEIGIVLMGVDVGVNALQFDNIEDYYPVEVTTWDMIEKVLDITPSAFPFTNWITGLRAGIDLMQREAVDSKRKTMVVIMDCPDAEINQQEMKEVADNILDQEIALLWIGTSSMLNLGREQRNNSEKMVQRLCRRVNGKHATFLQLLPNVRFYGGKQPNPVAGRCDLEISDIRIPTLTYVYITENSPIGPWKNIAQNPESENPNDLIKVSKTKALADYHKNEYEMEDIVRGYKYGGSFVPMTDDFMSDLKNTNTKRSLILYGFVAKDKVKLSDRCGKETHMVLPAEGGETHFFSLVKAMVDLNVVAIVRSVSIDKCDPKMKILYPQAGDPDKPWCFIMIDIAFKENRSVIEPRTYEEIYKCLKDDEWDAIDNLIDHMMLKDPTPEDEDKRSFEPGTVDTPDIQHVWNRLADRALNPLTDGDPPTYPPADYIMELIRPPKYLQTDSLDRCIDRVIDVFELNKEPVVETSTVVAEAKAAPTNEKTNECGYATPLSLQTNDSSTQMDVDLDALCD